MTDVIAEMTGSVRAVVVGPGDVVREGQELLTVESMKMEIPVEAPAGGRVASVHVAPGDRVSEGQLLVRLDP